LSRLGLEPTIYRTGGEHGNHYTIDGVKPSIKPEDLNKDFANKKCRRKLFKV
jgi:hypothetical protein